MNKVKLSRSLNYFILSLSGALVFSSASFAASNTNATYYGPSAEVSEANQVSLNNFTTAELEQMLAPIALYPDTLLTHILMATTYPIEVVDAERWLTKNQHLSAQELADAAEDKDWDASVKALLPFPNVLKKLSDDLYWMRNVGDAFLQDEAQVLASVQRLRKQADQAGNLDSMDNVKVIRESRTIIIEPRQPDIIYVPYYDTRVVYGQWRWSHYPPIFWHHPVHYVSHHGPYYWHNPVHLTVGLFFGAVHWNNHHVVVHHHKSRYYKRHSKNKVSTSYQAKRWQHNPRHRKGVAYRTSHIQKKYRSHTPSTQQHKMMRSKQKQLIKNNKHLSKHTSTKHQNLKHKLKVNRAVKIDQNKHKLTKHDLIKHEPYKAAKWRKNKTNTQTVTRGENTAKAFKSKNKPYANQQKPTKNRVKKDVHKRGEPVFTNERHAEKRYTKPTRVDNRRYTKKHHENSNKAVNKRTSAKVAKNIKPRGSRTPKNRREQHN
jgi:hypothetical protein